jgi:hypothetical protein
MCVRRNLEEGKKVVFKKNVGNNFLSSFLRAENKLKILYFVIDHS